jgi:C4-dicarboxylate transporter
MIQVLIALLVIVVVARLILKGYRAEPVLFIAGLVLMICTALTGWGSVLPKGLPVRGFHFSILSR